MAATSVFRPLAWGWAGVWLLLLTSCAHSPCPTRPLDGSTSAAVGPGGAATPAVQALQESLAALAAGVNRDEASRVARRAYDYSCELAHNYQAVRPALWHNFLVNVGLKKRGLCYHWAEDLLAELQALNVVTLEFHWGIARSGTTREHNSVVVTATAQAFAKGIVLDAWRYSGRLHWSPVTSDRYPWQQGEASSGSTSQASSPGTRR